MHSRMSDRSRTDYCTHPSPCEFLPSGTSAAAMATSGHCFNLSRHPVYPLTAPPLRSFAAQNQFQATIRPFQPSHCFLETLFELWATIRDIAVRELRYSPGHRASLGEIGRSRQNQPAGGRREVIVRGQLASSEIPSPRKYPAAPPPPLLQKTHHVRRRGPPSQSPIVKNTLSLL